MRTRNDLTASIVNLAESLGSKHQPDDLVYPIAGVDAVAWSAMDAVCCLIGGDMPLAKRQLVALEALLQALVTLARLQTGDELVSIRK